MTIRENFECFEENYLSKYASKSNATRGRRNKEQDCDIRTHFQRDRDRILHCKSFRRLKHKTQVFLSPQGDHYRTRLTHTLEVSQISRTIARALKLNEDLVEAIALGHDLGHAPFGHAGERALDKIVKERFGICFKHFAQSVRVVTYLERYLLGLNLTFEVINGIACHSSSNFNSLCTLEGKVVNLSDKIAYINHDIDDACRANILKDDDLPKSCIDVLGDTKSKRITTLIISVIENSLPDIKMGDQIKKEQDKLRNFLFENVYKNSNAKSEEVKVYDIINGLFSYYYNNKDKLPHIYLKIAEKSSVERAVLDYISGMTDMYAINDYKERFIPKSWNYKSEDKNAYKR